jgi:hypothetical protein
MAVRVLRLMEYVYVDMNQAHKDMERWVVQGTYQPGMGKTIRSTILLNPTPFEEPTIVREVLNDGTASSGS